MCGIPTCYKTTYAGHMYIHVYNDTMFSSVLSCCWLGIQPVKQLSDEVLAWLSPWSEVQMIYI